MLDLVIYTNIGRTVLHTFKKESVSSEELLDQLRTCKAWDSYSCDTKDNLKITGEFTAWCGFGLEPTPK